MSRDDYAALLERAVRRIRRAKAEVAESRRPPSARCPIALIGYACRLPGADDPEAYWALLRDGVDAVGPAPAGRFPDGWFDPTGADPNKVSTDEFGFIDDLAGFDPEFFGISPREAVTIDPQQRLVLEVAWQALERAGIAPGSLKGSRTGVYVGASNLEYGRLYINATGELHNHVGTSSILSVMAGRVAYVLGLEGPAIAVDTACSSSLVSVALGMRALQSGDCDLALCGGVNAMVDPTALGAMAFAGMLAERGRCRPFDAGADGFGRGEGCGMVVLARLDDAARAGHRIHAVLRGVAVNQDGRSAGLTAPNTHAQVAVIRAALADGGLDPLAVSYLESHGTGTRLGDPIEMSAVREALCTGRPADAPLVIGAAKSNIGHLEPAAGVAGLIKAALVLAHGAVPPNLHFETPNPHIEWDGLPVLMPREVVPLRPGLVGVSAFGLSGTNAHLVLGPPPEAAPQAAAAAPRGRWILPLSARTPEALAALAARYVERLADDPESWPDVAGSAALGREMMAARGTVVAADAAGAIAGLKALAEGRDGPGVGRDRAPVARGPQVGFVFTGQGAQYGGMGRRLYAEEPAFAAVIDRCAALLAPLRAEPLLTVLFDPEGPIDETAWTQPALFALQVALAALWRSLGVVPHAVVGHSVGAYAAAVVAGALTLEDGLRLVAERGRLMGSLPAGGAMATVDAGERRVLAIARATGAEWVIAAVNGPDETVISGPAEAIEAAAAAMGAEGLRVRRLAVSHGFHSPLMQPVVEPFRAVAAGCAMARPAVRFIDDRTGAARGRAPTADDWARHLREPVRFADAVRALAGEGCDALVEIGPRPALLAFARRTLGADCPPTHPSLSPDRPVFADSLAALWRVGAPVDWRAYCAGRGLRRVPLPTYPFQRRRLWFDPPGAAASAPTIDRERFALRWQPRPPAVGRPLGGRWLVVGDGDGLGPAALDALRAAGVDADWVPGPGPESLGDGMADGAPAWDGVLDLAALDQPAFDPDAADPEAAVRAARRQSCDGVPGWLDALSRRRSSARLVLVTRRAVPVGGEPADPLQALRTGLGRVALLERPGGGLIDVDAGPPAAVAAALVAALTDEAPELALRGGARFVPRLVPLRPEPIEPPALDGPGAILITGGAGALGLAIAGRLIERGAKRLTLMSRRPPSPAAAARIAAWNGAGAQVQAVAGDVTRAADIARALAAAPVTGVIHAAGVLDDGLLLEQTPARFDRVIGPKLLGAWNLHRAAPALDFMVLFSSVVGVMGSPGQANYAAANSALDAFAAQRTARGLRTLTLRWGPWHEHGMTAGLDLRRAQRSGVEPLPEARALAAFERALADHCPAPVILALGDPPPPTPLFSGLAPAAGPVASAPTRRSPRGHLRAALADAAEGERVSLMLGALVAHIAAALGLDADGIDADRAAVDLGLDSLLVLEVLEGLEHDLDLAVYPREFYSQPSLRAMADYLLAESSAAPAPAADAPAPAAEDPGSGVATEGPLAAFEAEADRDAGPSTPVEGVGFVLSVPRSGSTLLRTMLHGHPALFAPPELWLLLADDMARRAAHLGQLGLDEGFTLAVREARGCSTAEAEAEVAAMVAERLPIWEAYRRLRGWLGERVLIDKTPAYSQFDYALDRVMGWFAPGPLIHLTRHPLAVMDSIVRTRVVRIVHGRSAGEPWRVAEGIWTTSAERLLALTAAHADRGRAPAHVRYEALVTRPRETLEALCDALGLPFAPAMLDPYAGGRMTGGLGPRSQPLGDLGFAARGRIDPSLAEAWRGVEPPTALDARTRAVADALGYALPARRDRVALPQVALPATSPGPRPLRFRVGGLALAGLEWGPADGPLVLAVHGLLDHAGVWAPVAEALAARGLRVVAPDLRGHGASDHVGPESGYSPLDHVHDLHGLLGALARSSQMPSESSGMPSESSGMPSESSGMPSESSDMPSESSGIPSHMPSTARPVAVLGHSMGAAVAVAHRVAVGAGWPLVLVEPPLPGREPASAAEGLGRWLKARTAAPHPPPLADLDGAIARLARAMPGVPADRLRRFAERAVMHAADGLRWRADPRLGLRAELSAGPLSPDGWLALLGGCRPPPRLIFGADSQRVRAADRQRMVEAVGPEALVQVAEGGHHLPLIAVEAIVEAVVAAVESSA